MTVSEFVASFLYRQGVTDTFGLPGGVILDLMYAFNAIEGMTPHLCYHEQSAGFAACGYAQVSGNLGVAYATKGPGFTNLITAISDAYYDSVPVIFITAHSAKSLPKGCRVVADQDMDTCHMVSNIVKYAKRIDCIYDVVPSVLEAVKRARTGRKGPVFLDIATDLFKQKLCESIQYENGKEEHQLADDLQFSSLIYREIRKTQRPIILIGDGINQSGTIHYFRSFVEKVKIPVLSSRYSHNIMADSINYYGYIGSHGIRYANFILSKADLIISLGNRLNFPSLSLSYSKLMKQARFLRFDIDEGELLKHDEMSNGNKANLQTLFPVLLQHVSDYGDHKDWCDKCDLLRKELWDNDVNDIVLKLSKLLQFIPSDWTLVADVGNNEFWVSRACVYSKINNRTLYSKSFGALGNAIGKAIGAYYATKKPVIVFIGDQGLQMNIQELQYISQHQIPIAIVLLNNYSSAMIKDREDSMGYRYNLHTTLDSGYGTPDFSRIAYAYNLTYKKYDDISISEILFPLLIEIEINETMSLYPFLPKGRDCQDMEPKLDKGLYDILNKL